MIADELEKASEAFRESEFYFRGESPVDRAIYWKIWWAAWQAANNKKEKHEQ